MIDKNGKNINKIEMNMRRNRNVKQYGIYTRLQLFETSFHRFL
jgi:hypothetical protein